MRSGIILAWLIGEGIIVWRSVARDHQPPVPGTLLASSALFALLALAAEYEPARGVATVTAFGLVLAAYLQAPGFGGGKSTGQAKGTHTAAGRGTA